MAFPAIYDFNYYKGDTFEFRIYPKKNDGTAFMLRNFVNELNSFMLPTDIANTPDYVDDVSAPYDSAQFTIAEVRGATQIINGVSTPVEPIRCFARVSDDGTHVLCAIRPSDADKLTAGTEYVYDVEVRRPTAAPGSYELVYTLMTGTISVTEQVTGATSETKTTLSNFNIYGLTAPVKGQKPDMGILSTSEYFGEVSWYEEDGITLVDPSSTFGAEKIYKAKITITTRSPYKIIGTPKNKFTVDGAETTTNLVDSGIVTATFPETGE
jgi:hypothetical protein